VAAIAGGVVGGVVGAIAIAGLIFWYCRRRRRTRAAQEDIAAHDLAQQQPKYMQTTTYTPELETPGNYSELPGSAQAVELDAGYRNPR
jgi:hypothetical protein